MSVATAKLLAYHSDPTIKEKYLTRVREHREADQLVKGKYWQGGKGCAVGCTLHSDDHAAYETELGLPEWLARLEDTLFESMPNENSMLFPERLLEAIPVGAWVEPVRWKFALFLLGENAERVKALEITDELKQQVLSVIEQVCDVNRQAIETGEWNESAWSAARSAARSAAESAAWSAWSAESAARSAAWSARSAAESAAWSAARSAAWSARSAAWSARSAAESAAWSARSAAESAARSAAESAAWSAWSAAESAAWSAARSAWSAAYVRYADMLIELLKQA